MAVKIRFASGGKKSARYFRIVATDERKKRNGKSLEDLGTYNAVTGKIVSFNKDGIDAWIAKGAIPTGSVKKVYKMYKKSLKEKNA